MREAIWAQSRGQGEGGVGQIVSGALLSSWTNQSTHPSDLQIAKAGLDALGQVVRPVEGKEVRRHGHREVVDNNAGRRRPIIRN